MNQVLEFTQQERQLITRLLRNEFIAKSVRADGAYNGRRTDWGDEASADAKAAKELLDKCKSAWGTI